MFEDIPKNTSSLLIAGRKKNLQNKVDTDRVADNPKYYLSFALRYSDGKKTAFFTGEIKGNKDEIKNLRKLELPSPLIQEKLLLPDLPSRKESFVIAENMRRGSVGGVKDTDIPDLISKFISLVREKADFEVFVSKLEFSSVLQRRFISNSEGVELFEEKSYYDFVGELGGKKGDELEEVFFYRSSLKKNISPERISNEVLSEFTFGGKPLKTGKYDVILTPKVAVSFIRFFIGNFFGWRVKEKLSRFSVSDLGRKLFSGKISLGEVHSFDGKNSSSLGKMADGVGWRHFDDEGSPTKNFWVVRNGEVQNFITSVKSARSLGVENTGSALRGTPTSLPSDGISSFFLEPGDLSIENMVRRGNGRFLIIVDVIGMHTGDDIKGDFSAGCRGFVMPDRIPFRTATISGNIYSLLQDAIPCSDFDVFGDIGTPSLLLQGVDISSS